MAELWGEQLRHWREAAELSRPQLARLSHVSVKNIYNLETHGQKPNNGTVTALADALERELGGHPDAWTRDEQQRFRAGLIPQPRISPEDTTSAPCVPSGAPGPATSNSPEPATPAGPDPATPGAPDPPAPTSTEPPTAVVVAPVGDPHPDTGVPAADFCCAAPPALSPDDPVSVRPSRMLTRKRRKFVGLTAGVVGVGVSLVGLLSPSVVSYPGPPVIPASIDAARWYEALHLTDTKHTGQGIAFGEVGDIPLVGDWDDDGTDEPAVYRPSEQTFIFGRSHTPTDVRVDSMNDGDWPLAGDWNADGRTDLGSYSADSATFTLLGSDDRSVLAEFVFGAPGEQPVVGDWDGDGADDVGVLSYSDRVLARRRADGRSLPVRTVGRPGDIVVVGDWDDDPADEVGTFRPVDTTFVFTDDGGIDPAPVMYGDATQDPIPVMGDWFGHGKDTQAVIQNRSR